MKRDRLYFHGCLIGGAIGDALGWPVEFLSMNQIKSRFGQEGISELIIGRGGKAEITDDTQMTIFTAEGLLRAGTRLGHNGTRDTRDMVWLSYLRWLYAQEGRINSESKVALDGWIIEIKELYESRAPGNSCLSALRSGSMGTIDNPINNSKGCGGVMRVAPAGLLFSSDSSFNIACDCAAITHGHPSGYLSAGVLAHIISCIIEGMELNEAVYNSLAELEKHNGHEECRDKIKMALELLNSNLEEQKAVKLIGQGWVGEEAIAIAIYCALKYKYDFRKALYLSVNHDGDSDSTGAITGNILGAYLGINVIPKEWIEKVELSNELFKLADDLFAGYNDSKEWTEKYPGH